MTPNGVAMEKGAFGRGSCGRASRPSATEPGLAKAHVASSRNALEFSTFPSYPTCKHRQSLLPRPDRTFLVLKSHTSLRLADVEPKLPGIAASARRLPSVFLLALA